MSYPEGLAFSDGPLQRIWQAEEEYMAGHSLILSPTVMPFPVDWHFVQARKAQAAMKGADKVVVAEGVADDPSHGAQAEPMVGVVRAHEGRVPSQTSTGAGYFSESCSVVSLARGLMSTSCRTRCATKLSYRMHCVYGYQGRLSVGDRMGREIGTKKGQRCCAIGEAGTGLRPNQATERVQARAWHRGLVLGQGWAGLA